MNKIIALVMPDYVADLTCLTLVRLGLGPIQNEHDFITSRLQYERGPDLTLSIMAVMQNKWRGLPEPKIALAISELTTGYEVSSVFDRHYMPVPTGPSDVLYLVTLNNNIRAMAWAVAVTAGHGECLSLPGRPALPKGKGNPWGYVGP